MKLKNIFSILIVCLVLICSIGAISAISDDDMMALNQDDDLFDSSEGEQLSAGDADALAAPQQETVLKATAEESSAVQPATSSDLSPYKQFANDLSSGKGTVYLNGDIQISKPFEIRHNVVIDGQSHTIDGQSKTNMIRAYSSTVTIKNTIFKNGYAEQGGAVYSLYGNLIIEGCTFQNNKAYDNGGAIYQSHGSLTVTGSNFISNKVESTKKMCHGGAIYLYRGHAKISNSIFKSNSCISKSLKKHSKATKYQFGGGAIYLNEGSGHALSGCTFQGNKASNHGGAVYVHKSKDLKINKCTFKNNRAIYEDGGAITFNGKKLTIKNSYFYNNMAYEDGGVMDALSLTKQKTRISISGCTFQGNIANKGGGVFWMGKKTVFTMKNSKFIKNKATIGGVFNAEDTNAKISKCVFQGNKATKVTSWKMKAKNGHVLKHTGGVIMMDKKVVKFIKCTFKGNSATFGGVAYHKSGKLTFPGCKYAANKAKSGPKVKKE